MALSKIQGYNLQLEIITIQKISKISKQTNTQTNKIKTKFEKLKFEKEMKKLGTR